MSGCIDAADHRSIAFAVSPEHTRVLPSIGASTVTVARRLARLLSGAFELRFTAEQSLGL